MAEKENKGECDVHYVGAWIILQFLGRVVCIVSDGSEVHADRRDPRNGIRE